MSLSVLPDGPLRLIMTHVPLMERLRNCSFVCKAFHKAAASAGAASLELTSLYDTGREGFQEWLSRHGDDVTRLHLLRSEAPTDLPCKNLLELDLTWCRCIQLQKSDHNPGLLQSCRGLTQLKFRLCTVIEGSSVPKELAALSCLPSLQHLDICRLGPDAYESPSLEHRDQRMQLPSTVLKALTNLTHLGFLGHVNWTEGLKQDFSCLVQLQVLSIHCHRETVFHENLDMHGTKGWSALTSLKKLELEDCLLDAGELCAAANLRTVLLTRCGLCSNRTGNYHGHARCSSLTHLSPKPPLTLPVGAFLFKAYSVVPLMRPPSSWKTTLTGALSLHITWHVTWQPHHCDD